MAAVLEHETAGPATGDPVLQRPRWGAEVVRGLAVFAVYLVVNSLDWPGRSRLARTHADAVFSLEQRLHLDLEPALNRWLAPHHALRVAANYEYATTYVVSAFALLYWLYRRRRELYAWARTTFIRLNLVAIACFALYPLTPPRLSTGQGFVDTVRLGHTWGSWGSPLVGHANQLAAMPSLHLGWALWVSAVLARISGRRRVQALSAVHVAITLWVILATANHYLLDAVAAVVLVTACVALTPLRPARRVAAADAFFLHVETPEAPQHVGGVVLLDFSTSGGRAPSRAEVVGLVQAQLGELPRFRQVLHGAPPAGRRQPRWRWLRPTWHEADTIDWSWHVPLVDLTRADGTFGGLPAFDALVADVAGTLLPRDRPLWRLLVVHGIDADRAGVVLVVHHVVADGIGTVAQAMRLLTPRLPHRQVGDTPQLGPWSTVRATVIGLAQLATDGRARSPLPTGGSARRSYSTLQVPLRAVRSTGRAYGVRANDVLVAAFAGALDLTLTSRRDEVRTAVPLMMRDPSTAAEGNVTAAVLLDLPVAAMSDTERLATISARSGALVTPTRAIASRFVMTLTGSALPSPLHGLFARTVYGHRYFSAIVSDMPGPPAQLSLLGARLEAAFPLLPLAPSAPIAVGALGWNGTLCIGVATDPTVVAADVLSAAMLTVLNRLAAEAVPRQQAHDCPG